MEKVLQELTKMNERLESLEEANQVTRDIIKDMELRFKERFDRLDGRLDTLSSGQNEIRADIAGLRRDLFLEEGAREHADNTFFTTQQDNYRSLEKRVSALEAQLPTLKQQAA